MITKKIICSIGVRKNVPEILIHIMLGIDKQLAEDGNLDGIRIFKVTKQDERILLEYFNEDYEGVQYIRLPDIEISPRLIDTNIYQISDKYNSTFLLGEEI